MKQLLPFLLFAFVCAKEVTLQEAISKAETASATITSLQNRVATIDMSVSLYTRGENPELEIGTENFGISEFEVVLSQKLRFSSQKKTSVEAVTIQKSRLKNELSALKREIEQRVTLSYIEASQLQSALSLIDSLSASINQEIIELNKRISLGGASQLELLELQTLLLELKDEKLLYESELVLARTELNSLFTVDENETFQPLEVLETDIATAFLSGAAKEVTKSHPDLIELEIEQSEIDLKVLEVKAAKAPGLSLSGGYKRNNEAKENALLLGISFELPFNRASSLAEVERGLMSGSVEINRAEVERKLSAKLLTLNEKSTLTQKRVNLLTDERVPLAKKMETAATELYKTGASPLSDKIRYQRLLIELKLEALTLKQEMVSAFSEQLLFTAPY